jgi:ABC-type nitrate/sulfonate/bicarbonate transport system ATPase subunit
LSAGIEIRQVTKRYGDARSPLVVKGIDLVVPRGTLTTILGPSGCGKTTTLRMIAGLDAPTSGGDPHRRARRHHARPGRSQREHGVPELRAVPPHVGAARTWATA